MGGCSGEVLFLAFDPINTIPNADNGLETWPGIDNLRGQVYDKDLVYIEYAVLKSMSVSPCTSFNTDK